MAVVLPTFALCRKLKMLFFSLEFGAPEGNCCRNSQAEFPMQSAIRADKPGVHCGLAGICTVPGVSPEADSAPVPQPVRPEHGRKSSHDPVQAFIGREILGMQ